MQPLPSCRKTAAVATPHPAAAAAASGILAEGGSAVDAAVGAMLVCCVALPGMVGLGGYGGSMVAYLGGPGRTVAIDFDSRAPAAYRSEYFGGEAATYSTGARSVTAPAVVAGLALALERFGTRSWAEVSAPAIALAEQGIAITPELKPTLDAWATKTDAASLHAWFPAGRVPETGSVWVQRDLAALLRRLADEGPSAFYQGEVARTIVRQVRDRGGILAEEDLARCRATVVDPLAIDYRGLRVLTPPPPSGGLTSLQMLRTLERFDVASLEPAGDAYFHLIAEAARYAWRDRQAFLGDPDLVRVPVDRLLSDGTAHDTAVRIRAGAGASGGAPISPSSPHTVNVVAADPAGNVVSMTATLGGLYGSTVVVDGLGLVLGHGMSRFTRSDGSPNAPAAGKRMLHNMAPIVVLDPHGRPRGAVGLPGGTKIVTVSAQLVVALVDFGMTPAQAVHAGRVHVETGEPLAVSSAVTDTVIEALRARGHSVRRGQDSGGLPNEIGGTANALWIDPNSGAVAAASQSGPDAAATVALAV